MQICWALHVEPKVDLGCEGLGMFLQVLLITKWVNLDHGLFTWSSQSSLEWYINLRPAKEGEECPIQNHIRPNQGS